jgi:DNA-binding TFAR19-related protein (PDSD5 family)
LSEDSELERLKAKRLAEMQKNISSQNVEPTTESSESSQEPLKEIKENPRDLLIAKLGYRGLEVLENAEYQFPNETTQIIQKLFELIKSGEINESFDGGQLLALFRSIGLNIKMQTKINVEQDGKFVSLSDKLSTQSSENGDD